MKLHAIDYQADNAPAEFVKSLHETGFAILKNHPISGSYLKNFYQQWLTEFFLQPDAVKQPFMCKSGTQHGFFPTEASETAKGHDIKDIKEFYQFYPKHQGVPAALSELTNTYFHLGNQIAGQLLKWIEIHTPAEIQATYSQPLCSMIDNSELTMLRMLHYPPMTGNEQPGAIRAAAHEDICFLTILPSANEAGLQIKTKDNQWYDVPCEFGHLIINIGDMLQEASAGYFPSTTHRVVNPKNPQNNQSRVSVPLFLHPYPEVVLSERYSADAFLTERLIEIGIL
ncbi:MAG: isopenicillin N synthase family oxygenase [Shewanellaceae bacterium]|nr:isopenicillin N synthase family oxygenase [Shewanellaceae bacterium]